MSITTSVNLCTPQKYIYCRDMEKKSWTFWFSPFFSSFALFLEKWSMPLTQCARLKIPISFFFVLSLLIFLCTICSRSSSRSILVFAECYWFAQLPAINGIVLYSLWFLFCWSCEKSVCKFFFDLLHSRIAVRLFFSTKFNLMFGVEKKIPKRASEHTEQINMYIGETMRSIGKVRELNQALRLWRW